VGSEYSLKGSGCKISRSASVLAEYETGMNGEAEIGAWEIASGCGKYIPAWILNMAAFAYGVLFIPV
jgi:hypothetical protein